jgi:hypothetical protein
MHNLQNNMKECDKRNIHISSRLHSIYISSNNDRHPVTKTFTPLHYSCQHFTFSHLNFTHLHFTPRHYTGRHFTFSHLIRSIISYYVFKIHSNISLPSSPRYFRSPDQNPMRISQPLHACYMPPVGPPSRCSYGLRSSGMLRGVLW